MVNCQLSIVNEVGFRCYLLQELEFLMRRWRKEYDAA